MNTLRSVVLGIMIVFILKGFGLEWHQPIWWVLMIVLNIIFALLFNNPKNNK